MREQTDGTVRLAHLRRRGEAAEVVHVCGRRRGHDALSTGKEGDPRPMEGNAFFRARVEGGGRRRRDDERGRVAKEDPGGEWHALDMLRMVGRARDGGDVARCERVHQGGSARIRKPYESDHDEGRLRGARHDVRLLAQSVGLRRTLAHHGAFAHYGARPLRVLVKFRLRSLGHSSTVGSARAATHALRVWPSPRARCLGHACQHFVAVLVLLDVLLDLLLVVLVLVVVLVVVLPLVLLLLVLLLLVLLLLLLLLLLPTFLLAALTKPGKSCGKSTAPLPPLLPLTLFETFFSLLY